jgi:hypothetical protein
MKYDQYGQSWTTCAELFDMLYQDPALELDRFFLKFGGGTDSNDITQYNNAVDSLYADFPKLKTKREINIPVDEFDLEQQNSWHMPAEYLTMDIAKWVLDQCTTDAELQRCGKELLLYQERDAFMLLNYMKYLVDTLRANNVVWGVGRGSSVASFVLYKIGVHKINSLYYDLDPREFLK